MSTISRRKFINLSGSGILYTAMSGCVTEQIKKTSSPIDHQRLPFYRNQPDDTHWKAELDPKAVDDLSHLFFNMLSEGLHPGAQLAMFRNGKLVLELGGGYMEPDGQPVSENTLFQIRSTTKALATIVLLILHDRGHFSFDDPITKHWPGFGKNGKKNITIYQLMSHQAGLSQGAGLRLTEFENRAAIVNAMENLTPVWEPGTATGYHAANAEWIMDELILRWEQRSFAQILKEDVLEPLDIHHLFVGLPEEEYPRMAKMTVDNNVRERQPTRALFSDYLNRYELIRMPISWVSGVATAVDLARTMNIVAFQGTYQGHQFFSQKTFGKAVTPTHSPGEIDRILGRPIRWGFGFMLGSTPDVFGDSSHPKAAGHPGGSAGVAWADPNEKLSVAFLCNSMLRQNEAWERYRKIGTAVYACLK